MASSINTQNSPIFHEIPSKNTSEGSTSQNDSSQNVPCQNSPVRTSFSIDRKGVLLCGAGLLIFGAWAIILGTSINLSHLDLTNVKITDINLFSLGCVLGAMGVGMSAAGILGIKFPDSKNNTR